MFSFPLFHMPSVQWSDFYSIVVVAVMKTQCVWWDKSAVLHVCVPVVKWVLTHDAVVEYLCNKCGYTCKTTVTGMYAWIWLQSPREAKEALCKVKPDTQFTLWCREWCKGIAVFSLASFMSLYYQCINKKHPLHGWVNNYAVYKNVARNVGVLCQKEIYQQ